MFGLTHYHEVLSPFLFLISVNIQLFAQLWIYLLLFSEFLSELSQLLIDLFIAVSDASIPMLL